MTGVRKLQSGEPIALREHARAGDGADVPVRAPDAPPAADLHNVIPFLQRRAAEAQAPDVVLPSDVARLPARRVRERVRLAAFAVVSLALHGGLLMAFWKDPVPLASIGMEVISVEIVVGATAPAGVAATPGEQQVQAAAAPETEAADTDKAEEKATAQPQTIEVARQEAAPEQNAERPKAEEAKPEEPKYETAAALEEPAQAEQKPAVAMVDEPKPARAAPPKPVKDAKPAKEPRRIAAPTREKSSREAKASTPSTAANNVGLGRSDRDTNYPGLVSAHLRRYQQYPSDARSRGDQGTATVSFSLDGGGRVTSSRLVRGSGIASIDQEVQAMVRRASPFPAPPGGQGRSFTVPIAFRLN